MAKDEREQAPDGEEGRVTDALRAAIERTMAATAPAAGQTRERAEELVEGISKRGQEARGELARRGQEAGAEIARLGQEARDALSRRGLEATGELRSQLDLLEKRLASIEDVLKAAQGGERAAATENVRRSKPKAEG